MAATLKPVAESALKEAAQAVAQEFMGREDNGWRSGKPIEDPEKTKRWGFITAKPSEYLVHMRKGRIRSRSSGQGATCFKWPWDSVAVIPTTLQRLYFTADQVTREKVGVQVKGLAVYRIARPELAVRMLNFSYPERAQEKLAATLTEMFIGGARRLVANLAVEDCLGRRKDALAAFLMSEIAPVVGGSGRVGDSTETGWGVVIDTIEIQDVRILSEKVFSDMQAPFRNQLATQAREAELERERATEIRESEASKAIEEARARASTEMRELKARTESEAAATEHAEEMKRLALVARSESAKLSRVRESQRERIEVEAEGKKLRADAEAALAIEAESRRAQAEGEAARRKAEQQVVELESRRRIVELENQVALEKAQAERQLQAESEATATESKMSRLAVARAEGELATEQARASREVENQLTPERLQLELILRGLPEIARAFNQRFGEVKILSGANENPFAFLVQAFESVLEVARKSGAPIGVPPNGALTPRSAVDLRNRKD